MALFLLGLLVCVPSTPSATLINSPDGPVQGFAKNGTNVWRGLPFAAAPIGDLRFRPPHPNKKWSQTRDATEFAPSCLQMGSFGGDKAWDTINVTNSSEDCLYLNVYSPSKPVGSDGNDGLPVMVYLHAGEFRFGSSNDQESNWPYFARGSVVLVTGNARLGMFGFAAHDTLRERDPSGSTGNYGMQDQRAVLLWVQRSIRHFGGDPTKVTVFGESSGGSSVAYHLTNPLTSKDLFHQAILESPGLTQSKSFEESSSNSLFIAAALAGMGSEGCEWPTSATWQVYEGFSYFGNKPYAVHLGSSATALALCAANSTCFAVYSTNATAHQLISGNKQGKEVPRFYLQNMTAKVGKAYPSVVHIRGVANESVTPCLVQASVENLVFLNTMPPYGDTFYTDASAPTVDGVELKKPLQELVRGPLPKGISILGGSNLDEGTEFMSDTPEIACNATTEGFLAWAKLQFGDELGPLVPPLYTTVRHPTPLCRGWGHGGGTTTIPWLAAMRSAGDAAILCRTRTVLNTTQAGGSSAWWYHFRATPIYSANMQGLQYYGAFHGAEVPFVFGYPAELKSGGERVLSQAMGCYWINFAATGNPNRGPTDCAKSLSLPEWPKFGDGDGDVIVFTNTSITKESGLQQKQCDLFDRFP